MVAEHSPEDEARDQFATLVARELENLGATDITYDEERFTLKYGEDINTLNLGNFFQRAQGLDPSELKDFAEQIARQMFSKKEYPDDFQEARGKLLPKVWPFASLYAASLQSVIENREPFELPTIPLGNHLRLGVVYDLPETMQSVNSDQLEKWGITFEEAVEVAIENLEAISPSGSRIGDGLFNWMVGDSYDSSRFYSEELREWAKLKGNLRVMIPNRESCHICRDDDYDSQKIMLDLTDEAIEGERPLTAIPLINIDGQWVDWWCPDDNPNATYFHYLQVKSILPIYGDLRPLIAESLKKKYDRPVVTSMQALVGEKHMLCFCLWPDIDSDCIYLPICEKVMFNTPEGIVSASWNDVLEVMRDAIEPGEVYPPHVRVTRYPTPEEFARFGDDGLLAQYVNV